MVGVNDSFDKVHGLERLNEKNQARKMSAFLSLLSVSSRFFVKMVSFSINLVFNPFVGNQSYGDGPFLKIFLPRDSELSTHSSTVFAEHSDIYLHTFTDSPS